VRIISLRLAHFRGVAEREITLPDNGVVVIEGPNEIGKSSMAEAFDLLLSELDSSKKKHVKAIKPVHLDEGPEVEAEIESGPYRFRYRKRFLKRPETVLTVIAPRAENLTGRTAHERVNAILDETMDRDLFEALRVQQHDPFAVADLGSAQSLADALNRSAGQEVAGERESTLLGRVEDESLRYFTATGRPTQLLKDALAATGEAEESLSEMRERLQALQSDIDSVEGLERRLDELEKSMLEQQKTARARRADVDGIKEREVRVARLQVESERATLSETAAREAVAKRRELVKEAEKLNQELKDREEQAALAQPELDEAEQEAKTAAEARDVADESTKRARAVSELRGKDKEFQHYQRDLQQMHARRDAIHESIKGRAEAQAVLDAARIDEALLRKLEDAHVNLQVCEAQAQARGAQLRIEAQRDLALRLDDEDVELASGEARDHVVTRRLSLELPGHMKIEFQGGAGSDELQAAVVAARESFAELLARAGVESLGDARAALERRVDAERARGDCTRRIAEKLEDQSGLEALVEKIENFEANAASILQDRPNEPSMPADFGAAQEAHRVAKEQADLAEKAVEPARIRDDAARTRFASLKEKTAETRVGIQVARGSAKGKAEELARARTGHTDEALDTEFGKLRDEAERARDIFEADSRELEKVHPEKMRELADNAERAADRVVRERKETADGLIEKRTRISVVGGEGLFEAEQEADIHVERCRSAQESLESRAAAARLLFETMRDAEADARRNYAAPLRNKIVELGRLVFDDSFEVELDESLAVHERTLNGRTVPFDSLSVGAREQIGLITRLACALLVDPKDGVPVILDDTLGSADPQRLEGLGAMLSLAGRQAQVIVLTCTPGRFRHIGDATVIRF